MSDINEKLPELLQDAVLKASVPVPDDFVKVKGIDYSKPEATDMRATDLIEAMENHGFSS